MNVKNSNSKKRPSVSDSSDSNKKLASSSSIQDTSTHSTNKLVSSSSIRDTSTLRTPSTNKLLSSSSMRDTSTPSTPSTNKLLSSSSMRDMSTSESVTNRQNSIISDTSTSESVTKRKNSIISGTESSQVPTLNQFQSAIEDQVESDTDMSSYKLKKHNYKPNEIMNKSKRDTYPFFRGLEDGSYIRYPKLVQTILNRNYSNSYNILSDFIRKGTNDKEDVKEYSDFLLNAEPDH